MKRNSIDVSKETFHSTIAQFSVAVIAFITLVIVSRKLGPEAFGIYAVLLATGELMDSIIDGFGEGIKKRVTERGTNIVQLFNLALASHIVFLAIISPLVIAFSLYTTIISPLNGIAIVIFASGSGLFTLITSFNSGLGYPTQSYKYRTIKAGLILLTQVPLAYLGANENQLVIAAGLSWGLAATALTIKRRQPLELPTKKTIKTVTPFAKWSIPNKLLFTSNERLPYFIIGLIATSTLVGYYEVAWKLVAPALLIPYTIASTLTVHISHKSDKGKSTISELKTALSIASTFAFPILIGAILLGDELVTTVYSIQYLPAGDLLPILSIVVILQSFIIVYQAALRGKDNPRAVSIISFFRVCLKLLLIPIGLHFYGVFGVATAIAITDSLVVVAYTLLNNTFANKEILTIQITTALLMGLFVHTLTSYVQLTTVTTLAIIGFGGIFYITTFLICLKQFKPTHYYKFREKTI